MEEYKSNSNKSKDRNLPEKKVEKVVSGTVRAKKKRGITRFTDAFLSEDIESVGSYVLLDVLIPSVKRALVDIVTNGVNMIFYGEKGTQERRPTASYISYNNYSKRNEPRETGYSRNRDMEYDEIILESRGEAEEVLMRLDELVAQYGMASIADLYDLVGMSSSYTANKYGWTDLHRAKVVRVRDGYLIDMPRAIPLD